MIRLPMQSGLPSLGKTLMSTVGVIGAALWMLPAQAQLAQLTDGLPLWQPGHAITTNIKDALPIVTTLKGFDDYEPNPIPDNWVFTPGYYRSEIRSYCLHAGTYGPTKGDGYLIAPLKGDRAPVIRNMILRSQLNPSIDQHDVQRLIWGTEDGAQWSSYDNEFKLRVAPLLSPEEIAILNLEPQRAEITNEVKRRIGGLIPGQVRKAVDTYADLRNKITGTTSYEALENIAVKTGEAPWGKDSRKDVKPGAWAYVGDGFYIRAFPSSYSRTTLEIYKVGAATVKRDEKGRIVRFDSDGYIIDARYDDMQAMQTIDGKSVPVWKFKSITYRHPDGRVKIIENRGYVVVEPDQPVSRLCSPFFLSDDGGLGSLGHFKDGMKSVSKPTDLEG
jgi:hypothetical protein